MRSTEGLMREKKEYSLRSPGLNSKADRRPLPSHLTFLGLRLYCKMGLDKIISREPVKAKILST